jgi:hypothetical protein
MERQTMMMYVVYQTPYPNFSEDIVCAISQDRDVACDIAGELEAKMGGTYWVDDLPVSHSLGEYKEQNGET